VSDYLTVAREDAARLLDVRLAQHALRAAEFRAALDQWYRERPWARQKAS
jgi:hypothetical protein